ncbi:MAG: hypothetical protein ACKVWV_02430 [Planctomycetota bacterium]
MNYPGHELDRMSAKAWSAVASDVGRVSDQVRHTGGAFVRDHPTLSVAGVAAFGLLLSRAAIEPKQKQARTPRRPQRRERTQRAKKSSGAMSAIAGLLQAWVLEAVTSMLKPGPAAEAEVWNGEPTRN